MSKTLSDYKTNLGDAPIWDAKRLSLFYVDVFGMEFELYRYDWMEKKLYKASVPINLTSKIVDFLIPIEGSNDLFAILELQIVSQKKFVGMEKRQLLKLLSRIFFLSNRIRST